MVRIYAALFTLTKKNKTKKKRTLDNGTYPSFASPTEHPSGILGLFTHPYPTDRSPWFKTRNTTHPYTKPHLAAAFVYNVSENGIFAVWNATAAGAVWWGDQIMCRPSVSPCGKPSVTIRRWDPVGRR